MGLATVLIKIIIEFPGLLRLKCIYSEDSVESEDRVSHDLEKVSDNPSLFAQLFSSPGQYKCGAGRTISDKKTSE